MLGGLFGGGGPDLYTPKIDPNALSGLKGLNLGGGSSIPGADALWGNINKAYSALNPIQSAMTANAGRAIEAGATRDRRAITGSLGGGVGSAAIGRAGEIAGANTANAAEGIAGQIAGQTTGLAQSAASLEMQQALQRIQALIAENESGNSNLLAQVGQANLAETTKAGVLNQGAMAEYQAPNAWASGLMGLGSGVGGYFGNQAKMKELEASGLSPEIIALLKLIGG